LVVFALLWLHPEADKRTFARVLAEVVFRALSE
jgi:hypothetical protein